jgi:hypothetical protein
MIIGRDVKTRAREGFMQKGKDWRERTAAVQNIARFTGVFTHFICATCRAVQDQKLNPYSPT